MKNLIYLSLFVLIATASLVSCDDDEITNEVLLTQEEENDLLFLREEEKLARDVYLYSFDKYGLTISDNISISEQNHMDKVLSILNQYNLTDPASTEIGVFSNADLQALYNNLIAKVDSSMMDALLVGATIEDLDIRDIEISIARTSNTDILAMYNTLVCGSRNHLRAYNKQIELEGGAYTPQYISQTEFDEILSQNHEQCGG
ncbi:MAG: DUF2202 domain-containing protein [Chitinophagales bacterium]